MKILYVTTVGGTMGFFKDFIKRLIDEGNDVDITTNEQDYPIPQCYYEWGCKIFHIDTSRSPLSFGNVRAIKQLKKIVIENKYDIVHCHTPIAAMCTRIACRRARKSGTRVIYTAHGFHFFRGAPKKNWLLYYPVEKLCARFTDVLITINREDYDLAKRKLRAGRVEYVAGVGIDVDRFACVTVDKAQKKASLGIGENAPVVFSVGELNENKNHRTALFAISKIDGVHYVVAGKGALLTSLNETAASLGISDRVHFLGYREDVLELYGIADVFLHPSYREGLPVSVMEAMASGLAIVASRIRGNEDLVEDAGGILVAPSDVCGFREAVEKLICDKASRLAMGEYNKEAAKKYSSSVIDGALLEIYG